MERRQGVPAQRKGISELGSDELPGGNELRHHRQGILSGVLRRIFDADGQGTAAARYKVLPASAEVRNADQCREPEVRTIGRLGMFANFGFKSGTRIIEAFERVNGSHIRLTPAC